MEERDKPDGKTKQMKWSTGQPTLTTIEHAVASLDIYRRRPVMKKPLSLIHQSLDQVKEKMRHARFGGDSGKPQGWGKDYVVWRKSVMDTEAWNASSLGAVLWALTEARKLAKSADKEIAGTAESYAALLVGYLHSEWQVSDFPDDPVDRVYFCTKLCRDTDAMQEVWRDV